VLVTVRPNRRQDIADDNSTVIQSKSDGSAAAILERDWLENSKFMRHPIATIVSILGFAFASTNLALAVEPKIPQLSGTLTESTYQEFEKFVDDHVNKVIALKITVQRSSSDAAPLQANADNGKLVVYLNSTPDEPSESEIVAGNGFSYQNGSYALEGFFIARNSGMHQGVISYSLKKADGSAAKLDPSTKLEQIELGKQSQ
jgi:hypothetical protein